MPSDADMPPRPFFDHDNKVLLVEFTDVTELGLQLRDWPELGNDRRAIRGKPRVLVAPLTATFSSLRLHGTYQAAGDTGTQVVPTRAHAERALGLRAANFESLDLP